MSLYPELDNLPLDALIAHFQGPSLDGEAYAASYYTELAVLISDQGRDGALFLLDSIDSVDLVRLQAIIAALAHPQVEPSISRKQLLAYLDSEEPMIVMEAVDGLRRFSEKQALQRVMKLLQHPSPYVKGSVLRFLSGLYPAKAFPILLDSLSDADFIVRENAADELGELGYIEATPYLLPLLKDRHPDVRQAAQTALEAIQTIAEEAQQRDQGDRL